MAANQDPQIAATIGHACSEARAQVVAGRQAAVRAGTILSRVATDCDLVAGGSARRVDVLIRQAVVEAVRALAAAEASAAAAERAIRAR